MTTMTAKQAAKHCKDNLISIKYWNCGYTLETILELDHSIKLEHENAWVELENILYYNNN